MDFTTSPSSDASTRIRRVEQMVLSASGWRAVFADSEESLSPSIAPEFRDIVATVADLYTDELLRRNDEPTVVVGTDTRPTGPMIADTAIRTFLVRGIDVQWIGVSAAPEIMSYTKRTHECDGFFYISASHNPPGHNGLKIGFSDGAVMPGTVAFPMIAEFRNRVADQQRVEKLSQAISQVDPATLEKVYSRRDQYKRRALEVYRRFTLHVGTGVPLSPDGDTEPVPQLQSILRNVRSRLTERPIGIVADLNGSARSLSIDHAFFPEIGARIALHNDVPGLFAHQILPEGAGLDEATKLLQEYYRRDPAFQIAYVPDNDGDRGNLVFIDPPNGTAVPLEAQTVFALVVMVELAWARYQGVDADKIAVVANGPTSLRIDRICSHFGARLFRAEVGEANVVRLGRQLHDEGWIVAILGEGSNGGNITPPGTVRDPLSTLFAMIKLHAFSLSTYWNEDLIEGTSFLEIARSLPAFLTIQTDDPRAKMHVGAIPHAELKRRYETRLEGNLSPIIHLLESHYTAPVNYRILNYEQTETREGTGNRTGDETGGLGVTFCDARGIDRAAVWMRGSGTEPVFRVLADCEGSDVSLLDELISWQREMVTAAAEGEDVEG